MDILKKTGNTFYLLFVCIGCLLSASISAQTQFNATVSANQVSIDDVFQLEIQVTSSQKLQTNSFVLPDLKDFTVIRTINSSGGVDINGVKENTVSVTYVLKAKKTGTFTIGSASVNVNGTTYKTQPIKITVSNSSNSGNANNPIPNSQQNKEVFINLELSNTTPYLNESIVGELKLYASDNRWFRRYKGFTTPTSISGFTFDKLSASNTQNYSRKIIGGRVYVAVSIAKFVFIPTQTGEIQIPPFYATLEIPRDYFNTEDVEIFSPQVKINVKDLPTPPNNFKGAVGTFSIKTSQDKTSLKANETVNVKVEVTGEGNMNVLKLPELNTDENVEFYNPKEQKNITPSSSGLKGTIVSNQVLVPLYGGDYNIYLDDFVYFDVNSETYKTITIPPFTIQVDGPQKPIAKSTTKSGNQLANTSTHTNEEEDASSDSIDDILPNTGKYSQIIKYASYAVGAFALMGLLVFFVKRSKKDTQHKTLEENTTLRTIPFNRYEEILQRAIQENDYNTFYSTLDDFLISVVPNPEKPLESLSEKYNENIASEWQEIKHVNEHQKYAPEQLKTLSLSELYQQAKEVIKKLT